MRSLAKEENSQRDWGELSGTERHGLRAVEGWLDFGLIPEAAEELSAIKATATTNAVVLKTHLRFWCEAWFQLHGWENLLCAARATIIAAPEWQLAHQSLSTALSNIRKLHDALKQLLEASDFPSPFKELYSELESHAAQLRDSGPHELDANHPIPSGPPD